MRGFRRGVLPLASAGTLLQMQRLFTMFPAGTPGLALALLRLSVMGCLWQRFLAEAPAGSAWRLLSLGIISNWDERLRPLLAKLDLAKYFEVIIISCEVGFPKPSPVIFEQAAKKLGLASEFILHVGDSDEHDAEGAAGTP